MFIHFQVKESICLHFVCGLNIFVSYKPVSIFFFSFPQISSVKAALKPIYVIHALGYLPLITNSFGDFFLKVEKMLQIQICYAEQKYSTRFFASTYPSIGCFPPPYTVKTPPCYCWPKASDLVINLNVFGGIGVYGAARPFLSGFCQGHRSDTYFLGLVSPFKIPGAGGDWQFHRTSMPVYRRGRDRIW